MENQEQYSKIGEQNDIAISAEQQQEERKPDPELKEVFDRIKTHFPPAKVKKIMQTDEDIGKVSQATPVLTGRALEFFIALLVKKSGDIARESGTKRITSDVLKQTILTDEKFDFLREYVCGEEAAAAAAATAAASASAATVPSASTSVSENIKNEID
ncbi:negative cofactor 2 transcription regulator complex subunit BUR6 NDAI_0C06040 [Naumovozyma dairenensis CBS 421]|uniref:Transcription factor CBF/NF-Y/archaeal histone domain-containing protein n=1 Tax=Naumovozyma dairenensis (strain ATCC 10597 / BCRC 20456 / CBS 421 / NBRC 0211 / NRRL Y-12639) TaxID=1071378 RepID=G0W902_NAUDC|nr:hypothetical protein NDAI_0C06040 [Naumovozyma dairenensis CBS 421]CCD24263.1 hypothetical protein NDAI_0C06040 [Naumovozyma dairenensis CBS 421]